MTTSQVAEALRRWRFRYTCEDDLQVQIAQALDREGISYAREARLDDRSRVDFLVGRVALEVKIKGSTADVGRQIRRYAACPQVDGVVLVTSRARHRFDDHVDGKPVEVVSLLLGALSRP